MKKTKYTKEILSPIVKSSFSMMEVLSKLGLKKSGGNHSHIKKIILRHEINFSHFLGKRSNTGKTPANKHTIESFTDEVLCRNGKGWIGNSIKEKLYEFNLKEEICEECGQLPFWNGKKLSLQLDHIDGDHFNNELENLKILCPNCHTQTKTYSVKKNKYS